MRRRILLPTLALALQGAGPAQKEPEIRLMGVATAPSGSGSNGLPVGGVSGIDYDPKSGEWYLISDDRSEHAPARFWRARIAIRSGHPPRLARMRAYRLRRPDGTFFPEPGGGGEALDSESLRMVPDRRVLIWSSEGDARDGFGPAVRLMTLAGKERAKLPLPQQLAFDPKQASGPRANLSFEGLSFEPDAKHLWLSLEAPLIQDGALAGPSAGATVRLTRFGYPGMQVADQYAYTVEPIGPVPEGRLADNGVSEILALDPQHLLVLERSGIQQADGDFSYRSRLYCADLDDAQDVREIASLRHQPVIGAAKHLVYDFASAAPLRIDNVEGMSLGPVLRNGNRTLVFVTDNDFSARRPTQLIALEIAASNKRESLARTLCHSRD